jgi:ketosteroid isomerase-like protein
VFLSALFAVSIVAAAEPAAGRAALVEQVRAAEVAFARSVAEKDRAAFAAAIDPDAVFVGGGGATVGRERIVAEWGAFFAPDAPEFRWRPELVELSGDGQLALTRGPWTMKGTGPDGSPFERSGTFNSVWRRQADGGWRVVFDAGCDPCTPAPPAAAPNPPSEDPTRDPGEDREEESH